LEADFHIVHGVRTRIQNTIRCIKELPLDVEDVVFGGLASAQVILTQHEKDLGALVVDIGGGRLITFYTLTARSSKAVPWRLAGDHITNDISMGLRIPMARAEKLKTEEGSCILGNCPSRRSDFTKGRFRLCREGNRARDAEHDHSLAPARNI